MTPLQVLQDRRFGAWLASVLSVPEDGLALDLDMAGHWPLDGSILDAFASLGAAPVEVDTEDVAAMLEMARRFAMHLHEESSR